MGTIHRSGQVARLIDCSRVLKFYFHFISWKIYIIIFNKKNILELTDDFRKMISSLFFVKMFISMDEFINEEHWPITKLVMSDISSSHQNKQTWIRNIKSLHMKWLISQLFKIIQNLTNKLNNTRTFNRLKLIEHDSYRILF